MGLEQATTRAASKIDFDRYRLRAFVEGLGGTECEQRSGTSKLSDVARALEGNPKAVVFEHAGSGGFPLVGNALASRWRFAQAFGVTPLQQMLRRLGGRPEVVEVSRNEPPVQEVVVTGDDVDLTQLPVHLQHGKDGG